MNTILVMPKPEVNGISRIMEIKTIMMPEMTVCPREG